MKTTITTIILLTTLAFSSALTINLKYGMKNDEVKELQEFLIYKGLLAGEPTGYFGILTLKAVKDYQKSIKLPNTGFVGQLTRNAINAEVATELASSSEAEKVEPVATSIATTTDLNNTTVVASATQIVASTTERIVEKVIIVVEKPKEEKRLSWIPKTATTTEPEFFPKYRFPDGTWGVEDFAFDWTARYPIGSRVYLSPTNIKYYGYGPGGRIDNPDNNNYE